MFVRKNPAYPQSISEHWRLLKAVTVFTNFKIFFLSWNYAHSWLWNRVSHKAWNFKDAQKLFNVFWWNIIGIMLKNYIFWRNWVDLPQTMVIKFFATQCCKDLIYFKLWIVLEQIILVWNIILHQVANI